MHCRVTNAFKMAQRAIPLVADNDPVEVIYEDDDIIAVNKPAGVISAPKHRFTVSSSSTCLLCLLCLLCLTVQSPAPVYHMWHADLRASQLVVLTAHSRVILLLLVYVTSCLCLIGSSMLLQGGSMVNRLIGYLGTTNYICCYTRIPLLM